MKSFIWEEKYRPQTISECVLSKANTKVLSEIVEKKQLQTMLFEGKPGTGKTTVALALCKSLNLDYLLINASEDSGIDILRTNIRNFASSMSLTGGKKVVILDEADYLNPNSTQPALRGFIQEFSSTCTFLFTCNYINRLIKPLHSRCTILNFDIKSAEKIDIAKKFFRRCVSILKAENVEFDNEVLAKLIQQFMPDWRHIVNNLQAYSKSGKLDMDVLSSLGDDKIESLMTICREKNFKKMRKWVAENSDTSETELFHRIYDSVYAYLKPECIPEVIVCMGEYIHKCAFSIDKEITVAAFLTEFMSTAEWKK